MIFLVNDANILIDLLKIDLLDSFFQLEYDFQVTDIAFAEIREENAADLSTFLENGLLTRQGFSFEELLQIQFLEVENPALSIADCSCLYLSRKVSATLLTGDAALRRVAEQNNIAVHGILWVLDEIVARGLISEKEARDKLILLMGLNLRLPANECRKRLKYWNKDT
jgi:predicted nucleic acid-binding protein